MLTAFHANTVANENNPENKSPYTNTFLCPYRSPIFPYAGPTTPKANIGPVMDQFNTDTVEFKSREMVSSETTKIVMVELVVNKPPNTTNKVAHFRVSPTLRAIRRGIICVQGTTDISSTPACSSVIVSRPCGVRIS
ncbi:unannotated protein [freshwater metagenome]|uniref:Unannotated protein n=1 Tax=freshwater metagenome TaxID=449393 RepID=A0A6J6DIQ0_9ZZZZ